MKKLHITIILILIWNFSYAQQYTNYSTKNGLPSNHVYRITQDYQGFIWFITDKGIVKYNGKTFKTFTTKEGLPSNDIWDIRIGHDNKVWFFTKATTLGYIENDIVYTFGSTQKNEVLYPIVINQNKNNIFFSDSKTVFHLENKQWSSQVLNNGYKELVNHSKIESLIFNKRQDSLKIKNHQNKIVKTIRLDKSYRTHKYRGQLNDSLFCWSGNENTHLLNLNTLQLKKVSYKFDARKFVRYSAVNNQIQFSGENFVSFLDENHQLTNTIQIPKHLNSHFSFVDKNKNLWVATFTNGVYFLPYAKQQATYSLVNKKVSKIQNVNGAIVASVYKKGFYKYDATQNKFQPFLNSNDFIFSANYIKELDTYYYVANEQTIQIKDKIKTKYIRHDFARNLIYKDSYLYANTSFGITKINPKNFSLEKEYLLNGIRNITLFNNKIVLATASGIKQFSKDKISSVSIGSNAFNKPITSLSKFNNKQLVVSTDGFGAYLTDLTKIEQLEQSDFLNIQSSFVDNNNIWLATNKGVWHYKKEGENFKLIRKYTTDEGLSLNQTNAVFILDDKLMASSNDGVSIIPINQAENNQFINLYFDKVTYNNEILKDNKVTYNTTNHLQVKIASIDFSSNKNFLFQYQLLPIQKKWITTTSSQIGFNDLPPKSYQLNIKSKGISKSLSFIIKPLWYQTLLAKLFFSLLAILFIMGIVFLIRKRELKKQAQKLNAKRKLAEFELHALRSQMNPHFVFNSLNAIQFYMNDNKLELSEKYLVKFSKLIRMFFDFSTRKYINIEDEIKLLNAYLEIEKLRFGEDFSFKINIKNNLNIERKIPVMLLQPIVENAVNHGLFHKLGEGLITVVFKRIDEFSFEVIIEDDGIGREQAAIVKQQQSGKHVSKSTYIIKDRLALLNESNEWAITYTITDVDTEKKTGTRVKLRFNQPQFK